MKNRLLAAVSVMGALVACENWADLEARARACQASPTCGGDGGANDGGASDAGPDDAGLDAGELPCPMAESRCGPGSQGCRNLSNDRLHCGACGFDCEGQTCAAGRCEPVTLGEFPENPRGATVSVHHLVVSGASVYVASANYRPSGTLPDGGERPFAGQVIRLNKNVYQPAMVLADEQPTPQFVAVRGTRVFYTNWESNDGGEQLRSVGTAGGSSVVTHFTTRGGLFGLSPWDNDLAFVANGGSSLFRWQEDGGVEQYAIPATGMLLVATSGQFAVTGSASPGALWRVDRAGGDAGVLALVPNLGKPWGLAIDDGGVFFADNVNGTVGVVPLGGGDVVELAARLRAPRGLTVDARAVYVVENVASGRVLRIDRVDGGVSELATNQSLPNAIAVDDEAIYWVTSGDGRVLRLRKRP